MKKNILSKLFCLLLVLSVLLGLSIAAGAETATSGTLNDNISWTLENGVLTLTGTGSTPSYSSTKTSPFADIASQVTSVVVGEGIEILDQYVLYQLTNVESIQLPSTLQKLQTRSLAGNTALKELTIPASVTVLGAYCLEKSGITDLYFEGSAPGTISGSKPCNGNTYNIHTPCGNTTWTAAKLAALGGTQTQVIEHSYENGACTVCGVTQTISGTFSTGVAWSYADGVLTISGTGATDGYTGMDESHPFYNIKDAVTSVVVEEGVTKLNTYLFYEMAGITQVQLPSTLTHFEQRAFAYCTGLTQITIPESVTFLGAYSFLNSGITSVYFESATPPKTSSSGGPFGGCKYTVYAPCGGTWTADTISGWGGSSKTLSLQHTVENNICTVCGLQYCGDNITWTFADGVLTLTGSGATYDYANYSDVNLESYVFYGIKDQVTEIVIGEGITKLGKHIFYKMPVEKVTLPATLTHMDTRALGGGGKLTSLTVPGSLSLLGYNCLVGSGLTEITFAGDAPATISTTPMGGLTYKIYVACDNATWTGDVLDKLGGTPALVPGHSFEGNTCTICGAQKVFAIVENGEEIAVYGTLIEAVSARVSGQLIRLVADAQVEMTLSEDLFIDLAGFDLSGTLTVGEYKVYGIDTTTDTYTGANRGIFSCVDENGTAIVPVSNFQTSLVSNNRYMAIAEETGYSFHRFYVGITHVSLKPDTVAVGYKAEFAGDDMVQARIASCGYSLQLGEYPAIQRAKDGVSSVLTLRVNNYDAANFGKTELYAVATMTLTDGTVIESAKQTITLYDLMHQINDSASTYSAEKLTAIHTMIDGDETMQTWGLYDLWNDADAAAALKVQVEALEATDNDSLTAFFESYDAQGYVHLTRSGAPYVISPEGTTVMLSDVVPDYVNRMTEADYNQLIALGESYISNMSGLVYGNMKTAFNAETTNEMDCSSFLQLVLGGVSYENSKYAADANTAIEGFGVQFPDNPYRTEFGAERYLANDLAQYAYDMGVAFTPNADATNMQPGDILFFSTKETNGYFMDITHAAICVERQDGNVVYVLHCSSDGDLVRYYEIDLFSDTIYGGLVSNTYKDSLVLIGRFPV